MTQKWVYTFDEIDAAEQHVGGDFSNLRNLFGGKGANLAEMARIGIPVPPGFIITTEACNAYFESDNNYPENLWNEVLQSMQAVEKTSGKRFGDPKEPLLVSCRSGAKFSMPGMMDTILNVGLNDETTIGLAELTANERFAFDSYRRLIQMFGSVVMGMSDELFENVITRTRTEAKVETDAKLSADHWRAIVDQFKTIFRRQAGHDFPMDPYEQLDLATEAVFKSWSGKRAIDYRNAAGIPHDLGTAVNIVTMVFGNMGNDCATGVAMTRSGATGDKHLEGDYLTNAQGEDVVAGIRQTKDIQEMSQELPTALAELKEIASKLEQHYRNMQDIEFTIERGKLWMLQTRDGKRTAQAAVKIAVDMYEEGLISKEEAVLRVSPEQVDFFLHPQFDQITKDDAKSKGNYLGSGISASPGGACGIVAMDADLAEAWSKQEGKEVIMVRPETKPDDVHGMLAAKGILTTRGGKTSHAALVARQFGKPAVVGISDMEVDMNKRQIYIGDMTVNEGDTISIDGSTGEVYLGSLPTKVPDIKDPYLKKLLFWADEFRTLGIWTNADYPEDAQRALDYGAEGIGLCRTEHMFFATDRLPHIQKMIISDLPIDRRESLDALLPFQRSDFYNLFTVMDGRPVIIRLIDPPLHEFLPSHTSLLRELTDLKIRLQHAGDLSAIDGLLEQIHEKEILLKRVESLDEANPMLGLRGVRLGIHIPELTIMQVRAIFEAACQVTRDGVRVHPKVMTPLTSHVGELKIQQHVLEE